MSVTFSGLKKDKLAPYGFRTVKVPGEEEFPRLNLANMNARAFLLLLGLGKEDDALYGNADLPTVRRAIIKARNTFDRAVRPLVRPNENYIGAGGARIIVGGIDESYFSRRLDDLASYVEDVAKAGGDMISWG
jgi:hypothetical protein